MGCRTRSLDVTGGMGLSTWGHGGVRGEEGYGYKGRLAALLLEGYHLEQ